MLQNGESGSFYAVHILLQLRKKNQYFFFVRVKDFIFKFLLWHPSKSGNLLELQSPLPVKWEYRYHLPHKLVMKIH